MNRSTARGARIPMTDGAENAGYALLAVVYGGGPGPSRAGEDTPATAHQNWQLTTAHAASGGYPMAVSTDGQQPSASLSPDERAELERLRAEVEAYRQRTGRRRRTGPVWRTIVAIVLIVLGSVLAPLAVTAVWLNSVI